MCVTIAIGVCVELGTSDLAIMERVPSASPIRRLSTSPSALPIVECFSNPCTVRRMSDSQAPCIAAQSTITKTDSTSPTETMPFDFKSTSTHQHSRNQSLRQIKFSTRETTLYSFPLPSILARSLSHSSPTCSRSQSLPDTMQPNANSNDSVKHPSNVRAISSTFSLSATTSPIVSSVNAPVHLLNCPSEFTKNQCETSSEVFNNLYVHHQRVHSTLQLHTQRRNAMEYYERNNGYGRVKGDVSPLTITSPLSRSLQAMRKANEKKGDTSPASPTLPLVRTPSDQKVGDVSPMHFSSKSQTHKASKSEILLDTPTKSQITSMHRMHELITAIH